MAEALIFMILLQLALVDGQTTQCSGEMFEAVRDNASFVVCATDIDNALSVPVGSRGECAFRCHSVDKCLHANYRDSNKQQPVCDLFQGYPCSLTVEQNCYLFKKLNQPPPPDCPEHCSKCCTNGGLLMGCRYDGCEPGYFTNSSGLCQEINECASNPCVNDATCVDLLNGFTCSCQTGFTGVHCETNIDECASSPCLNGGQCVDSINMFTCNCVGLTRGIQCENNCTWTTYVDMHVTYCGCYVGQISVADCQNKCIKKINCSGIDYNTGNSTIAPCCVCLLPAADTAMYPATYVNRYELDC